VAGFLRVLWRAGVFAIRAMRTGKQLQQHGKYVTKSAYYSLIFYENE
jgi:hypothetical protein